MPCGSYYHLFCMNRRHWFIQTCPSTLCSAKPIWYCLWLHCLRSLYSAYRQVIHRSRGARNALYNSMSHLLGTGLGCTSSLFLFLSRTCCYPNPKFLDKILSDRIRAFDPGLELPLNRLLFRVSQTLGLSKEILISIWGIFYQKYAFCYRP